MYRWYRSRIVILFMIMFHASLAFGQMYVKVLEAKGQVEYRTATQLMWKPLVKAQQVEINSLIQLGEGSSLAFSVQVPQQSIKIVKFNAPMIFRIDEQFLRTQVQKNYYFSTLPPLDKEEAPSGLLPFKWQDSWQRIKFFFADKKGLSAFPINKNGLAEHEEVSLLELKKSIKILTPKSSQILRSQEPNLQYQITWRLKQPIESFVYIWKLGTHRGEPLFKTKDQYYTATLKYGSYFVQVVAVDGTAESEAHIIQVLPLSNVVQENVAKNKYSTFPKHDTVFFTQQQTFSTNFLFTPQALGESLYVKIWKDQKQIASFAIDQWTKKIDLEPGVYDWKIVDSKDHAIQLKKFEIRTQKLQNSDLVINKKGEKKIFFLVDGFMK